MARSININVTEPQAEFLSLDCTYPAFVAGYGTGKSYIMCLKAILDSLHAPDAVIGIYEPSFKLVKKVVIPTMRKVCYDMGIDFDGNYHKTDFIFNVPLTGAGQITFCTMEEPEAIVGDECYKIHIDELDTFKTEKAALAWEKIIGRCRQWPRGLKDQHLIYSEENKRKEPNNQVCVYTTPEGFKFVYNNWVANKTKDTQLIKASTYSNPYLPSSYIEAIKSQYPDELISAYLYGEFVNLTGGNVYSSYDREAHRSREQIKKGETLYIGCDFNVTKQAACIFVTRKGGQEWHCVEELVDMYDTPEMIQIIKEKYSGHKIVAYPDASGNSRKSVDASISDIALLEQAGFEVRAKRAKTGGYNNPKVKDRVMAVNGAFSNGRIFVNEVKCPRTVECLEQQPYDKNGEPDKKGGKDHQNDAFGYPIIYEMPIRKPVAAIDVQFMI